MQPQAEVVAPPAEAPPAPAAGRSLLRGLGTGFWVSMAWIAVVAFAAVFAGLLPIDDPVAPLVGDPRSGPSLDHLLGTDTLGRSILARVVHGARVSLIVALGATGIGLFTGGVLGLWAGYRRGRVETVVMVLADVVLAFPALVIIVAVVAFAGANLLNILLVMGALGIPTAIRIVRGVTLAFAEREFVTSARALGARDARIMFLEIAPNVAIPALAFFFIGMAVAVVTEGSLAFLGLSVPPPDPTWGGMIAEGRAALLDAPHIALMPSLAMLFTVLAFNFAGDKLRELIDVRETVLVPRRARGRRPQPVPSDGETLLGVEGLRTQLVTRRGLVHAVDGVSLTVRRGQTVAVVGESGSGKTMLIRSILGLASGSNVSREGRVVFDGHDISGLAAEDMPELLGTRMSAVFQDPMRALNPVRRIGAQLTEPLMVHQGMTKRQARERAVELLRSVNVPAPERRLRQYPDQLSGGLRQRVTIALALSCDPDLLLADEPTTALDVTVQAQILALLSRIQDERRMGMVVVTHDLEVARDFADEIVVMYAGKVVERGPTETMFTRPRMPYTDALHRSTPRLDSPSHTPLAVIPGSPPDLVAPPLGCRFAPRCAFAQDRCRVEEPPLVPSEEPGHEFACWFPLGGAA